MKILITHAYAKDNKGDAAILSVLLLQLKRVFNSPKIKISTHDDIKINKVFEGYENISSFSYLAIHGYKNVIAKGIYSLYILSFTTLWALIYRLFNINLSIILSKNVNKVAQEFLKSDLIVPIGGGYIRSKPTIKDTVNLVIVLHPIILSIILRKKILLYTQSIGPFYNKFQKLITKVVLNRTNLIMVREDNTLKTLKDLGVRSSLVVRTVDAGFLFESKSKLSLADVLGKEKIKNKILVGITVRKWLSEEKQKQFETEIAEFIQLITKDKRILAVFIPQVSATLHKDDDRQVAKRIIEQIKNKSQVVSLNGIYSHHEIKSLYKDLNFIVGTRFHSVIFSLTSLVPAIAIEYEYKTSGIMKDLGLSQWVIPMEKTTAKNLSEKFEKLQRESKIYKASLEKKLPLYIKSGDANLKYIKKVYEN